MSTTSQASTARFRGPSAPELGATPAGTAGTPARRTRQAPALNTEAPLPDAPFEEAAASSQRRAGPGRVRSSMARAFGGAQGLTDAELAEIRDQAPELVLSRVAGKRLTVEQLAALLPAFPQHAGTLSDGMSRFDALAVLALQTDATAKELEPVREEFMSSFHSQVEWVLRQLPPPERRSPIFERSFVALFRSYWEAGGTANPEYLARHVAGRTFDSVQVRALAAGGGTLDAERALIALWPRWRGGAASTVLSGFSRLPGTNLSPASVYRTVPSPEARARLDAPEHQQHREGMLALGRIDRVVRLLPPDGCLLTALEIWDLVQLCEPRQRLSALERLAQCWDGKGSASQLALSVGCTDLQREQLRTLLRERQSQLGAESAP